MHRRSTAVVCKQAVWRYYRRHGRDLPWRRVITPYRVTVSEIMLQQTQVSRVMQKFEPFISRFPDWRALAEASTADIINEWRGLGYNRRAIYLKRIAESVVAHDSSRGQKADGLPRDFRSLCKLPGIGPNTAGSIMAFAFNIPRPFIETNIRSVILHFFFKNKENIPDAKLMPIIAGALADPEIATHAREWYSALMDYGAHLKSTVPNPSRQSAHHAKQKPFKGSNRELRSKILRLIIENGVPAKSIYQYLPEYARTQVTRNVVQMVREGFFGV